MLYAYDLVLVSETTKFLLKKEGKWKDGMEMKGQSKCWKD